MLGLSLVVVGIFVAILFIWGIISEIHNSHNTMEKKFSWLRDLINVAGVVVGIVLTAIGAIMFLNSSLKLYVFGFETSSYFNAYEQCEQPEWVPVKGADRTEKKEKTPEEVEECVTKKTEYEKERYARQQKEQMIDGFAFLFVGLFLWLLHKKMKKEE